MSTPFAQTTRALARDTPRMAHLAFAAAGALLVVWGLWFFLARVTIYEVSSRARLESAAAPRDVVAMQAGRLSQAELMVGREVRAGDVLMELDAQSDALMASEEQARLAAYPAKAEALRRQISALETAMAEDARASDAAVRAAQARTQEAAAGVDFALDNARRMKAQAIAGGVAPIEALKATADARKATSVREAAVADVRRLGLEAATRAGQARAQIEDLKRTLAATEADGQASRATTSRLQLQVARKTVRAPVSGVIAEALPLKPGAYVTEGEKVATIVPKGGLVLVAEFDPAHALGRLAPGQTARLRLDGFPWTQYGGVRARVARVAAETRDAGLRVELEPEPTPAQQRLLRHGLTGAVEVGVERVPPAVLLMRAAGGRS